MRGSGAKRWSHAQQRAIMVRGQDVLVAAGAGSGKTSVLVERVIRRVTDEDVDLQRVLVVTFTEAAAAEMRERIARRLHDLLEAAVAADDRVLVRRLSRQLAQLDQANISTLHSFCMHIVRRNFLSLNLDPNFTVVDEDEQMLLKARLCQELLEDRLTGAEGPAVREAFARFAQQDPNRWRTLVLRLDTFARSQPDPRLWLETMGGHFLAAQGRRFAEQPWTPAFLAWVRRQLGEALRHAAAAYRMADGAAGLESYADNLAQLIHTLREALPQFASGDTFEAGVRTLCAVESLGRPSAKKGVPGKDEVQSRRETALKRVRQVLQIIRRGPEALVQDLVMLAPAVAQLTKFVLDFQDLCEREKRRRGWVDFSDLEHLALRALRDETTGEAERLRDQFVEVYVDEYQDTSPIQDALIEVIRRPEGNLFEVGDVKQSIYRFRMAEPHLFMDTYRTLGHGRPGEVIDLQDNFRSRASIVHAVNHLFGHIFSADLGGIVYDERARMNPAANYPPVTAGDGLHLDGPVEVHLIERDTLEPDASWAGQEPGANSEVQGDGGQASEVPEDEEEEQDLDALEKEALVIGQRILELMGRVDGHPHAQVWDPAAGVYRPLQFRDIVVLLRSVRTQMNRVLEVFRRLGIPAYGATSTGFYAALEVKWLLAALTVVDNPRREVELAALLRSPIAGFTDEDLARIRLCRSGNFYDALRAAAFGGVEGGAHRATGLASAASAGTGTLEEPVPSSLRRRCRAFLSRLDDWRKTARRSGAEAVLRRIVEETGFLHYVLGMPGGDLRQANVEALLERARAFDRQSVDGVFGFVRRLREALAQQVDAGEARTLSESEDVVRVMTIHQSKGLEFPVVFVADLGKRFYRDPDERAFPLHRELGFGPQALDPQTFRRWRTLCSIAVETSETAEFLAEEARILYVALTRARERLILVGSGRGLMERMRRMALLLPDDPSEWPAALGPSATSYLDWLLPPLWAHPDGAPLRALVQDVPLRRAFVDTPARYAVTLWNLPGGRELPRVSAISGSELREAISRARDASSLRSALAPLLTTAALPQASAAEPVWFEPVEPSEAPTKVSATDLRRLWAARVQDRPIGIPRQRQLAAAERLLAEPNWSTSEPGLVSATAVGRVHGVAFHKAMHHFRFDVFDGSLASVVSELNRLRDEGWLSDEEAASIRPEDILALLASGVGRRIRNAYRCLREQPFFLRINLDDDATGASGEDAGPVIRRAATGGRFVVAQGVIDCLAEDEKGWVLVDYKTDDIRAEDVPAKAAEYAAQVATYRAAVTAAIGHRPLDAYLYFVKPRLLASVPDLPLARVFNEGGEDLSDGVQAHRDLVRVIRPD